VAIYNANEQSTTDMTIGKNQLGVSIKIEERKKNGNG
jgi:hypothetical protein